MVFTPYVSSIPATKNFVEIAGEDGLWTLEASYGKITELELDIPALRYLQMRNNELRTPSAGVGRFIITCQSSKSGECQCCL